VRVGSLCELTVMERALASLNTKLSEDLRVTCVREFYLGAWNVCPTLYFTLWTSNNLAIS